MTTCKQLPYMEVEVSNDAKRLEVQEGHIQ